MTSFTITPLSDHTGAEVTGIDFTKSVDGETGATKTFDRRGMNVFYQ